jgi:hypothetical protein
MLTFTFAGDEAGHTSLNFDKGATRHFVVAIIGTQQPDTLRDLLINLRQERGLPSTYEFKYNRLTSAPLRNATLAALAHTQFQTWTVVADKQKLAPTFHALNPKDFYLHFVSETIQLIPETLRQDSILILDEFMSAQQIRVGLRRILTARHITRNFRHIYTRQSDKEPLIQIADLVAGSILRSYNKNDSEDFNTIRHNITTVHTLP